MDNPDLDRLNKFLPRFTVDSEEEAIAALRFFRRTCAEQNIQSWHLRFTTSAEADERERQNQEITYPPSEADWRRTVGELQIVRRHAFDGIRELKTLRDRLKTTELDAQAARQQSDALRAQIVALENEIDSYVETIDALERDLQAKERELHENSAELATLRGDLMAAKDVLDILPTQHDPVEWPAQGAGYVWNGMLIPAGTRLRVHYKGHDFVAKVVDSQIRYKGQKVTPYGFVKMVKHTITPDVAVGSPYDALAFQFPGVKTWYEARIVRWAAMSG